MFKIPRYIVLLIALAMVLATAPAGIGIAGEQLYLVPWFENGIDFNMERGFSAWRSLPVSERSADNRFRLLDLSQLSVLPNLSEALLPGCLVGQCGDRSSGAVSEYDGGSMLNQARQFGLGSTAPPASTEGGLGADVTDTTETDAADTDSGDQEEEETFQAEEDERPPIPSVEDEEPLPIAAFPLAPPAEEEESFISSLPWWAWAVGGVIALVVLSSAGGGGGGGGGGGKSSGDNGSGGQGEETGSVGYTWN